MKSLFAWSWGASLPPTSPFLLPFPPSKRENNNSGLLFADSLFRCFLYLFLFFFKICAGVWEKENWSNRKSWWRDQNIYKENLIWILFSTFFFFFFLIQRSLLMHMTNEEKIFFCFSQRNLPARGLRPVHYLSAMGLIMTYGWYKMGQGIRERK